MLYTDILRIFLDWLGSKSYQLILLDKHGEAEETMDPEDAILAFLHDVSDNGWKSGEPPEDIDKVLAFGVAWDTGEPLLEVLRRHKQDWTAHKGLTVGSSLIRKWQSDWLWMPLPEIPSKTEDKKS
jgi:hypothetical protein